MSRILSILLMGLGGYFLFKKRFRLLNTILGNPMLRRVAVRTFMSIPGVKDKVIGSVFSQGPKTV